MSLVEYLYVDEHRLNSYFEQISSPISFDKTPTWRVGISLTGPDVEGGIATHARPFTTHEKIITVMKYLKKHDLLFDVRASDDEVREYFQKIFRIETITATKVFIPPRQQHNSSFSGLNMWISPISFAGILYLLEDFPRDDKGGIHVVSAHSALMMLWNDIHKEIDETLLGHIMVDAARSSKLKGFAQHPVEFLSDLGAKILTHRNIRTLYRVRAILNEVDADMAFTTIGYPIFISEFNEDPIK